MVVQTVTYGQTSDETGTIRATHRYRLRKNVGSLVVYDYDHGVVVAAEGFSRQANGRWAWDGQTAAPSVTVRVAVNRSSYHFDGLRWVDVGNWTLANPRTDFTYRDADRDRWVYSWQNASQVTQRTRVAAESDGFAGPSVVYLGPHESVTANGTGQQFRLVVPGSAAMADSSERVLTVLRSVSAQVVVGARDDVVNHVFGM